MDTSKIFLGIALIAFSAAMVIHPASAAMTDSCPVGGGILFMGSCGNTSDLCPDTYNPHMLQLICTIAKNPRKSDLYCP